MLQSRRGVRLAALAALACVGLFVPGSASAVSVIHSHAPNGIPLTANSESLYVGFPTGGGPVPGPVDVGIGLDIGDLAEPAPYQAIATSMQTPASDTGMPPKDSASGTSDLEFVFGTGSTSDSLSITFFLFSDIFSEARAQAVTDLGL